MSWQRGRPLAMLVGTQKLEDSEKEWTEDEKRIIKLSETKPLLYSLPTDPKPRNEAGCSTCMKVSNVADGLKMKACARCKSCSYCSRECQIVEWPNHKLICNKSSDFARVARMAARLTKNPEVMRFIVRDIVRIYRKDFIVGDGMINLEKMRVAQVIVYFEPCNWDHAAPKKFAAREGKSMPGSLRLARVQDATLLLSEDVPNPDPLAASVRKVWLQRRGEDYPTVVVQFWYQSAVHLTTVKVTPKDVNDFHSLKSKLRIFRELKQFVIGSMVGGVELANKVISEDVENGDTMHLKKEMSEEDRAVYLQRRVWAVSIEHENHWRDY